EESRKPGKEGSLPGFLDSLLNCRIPRFRPKGSRLRDIPCNEEVARSAQPTGCARLHSGGLVAIPVSYLAREDGSGDGKVGTQQRQVRVLADLEGAFAIGAAAD